MYVSSYLPESFILSLFIIAVYGYTLRRLPRLDRKFVFKLLNAFCLTKLVTWF